MERQLPVWLFLLCLLLGGLFTMFFAWSVKETLSGRGGFGRLGKAAVVIASFPNLVKSTIKDIGADPDEHYRVPRTSADSIRFPADKDEARH